VEQPGRGAWPLRHHRRRAWVPGRVAGVDGLAGVPGETPGAEVCRDAFGWPQAGRGVGSERRMLRLWNPLLLRLLCPLRTATSDYGRLVTCTRSLMVLFGTNGPMVAPQVRLGLIG